MQSMKIVIKFFIIQNIVFGFPIFSEFTKGACQEDAQKFCGDKIGIERGKCLNENYEKLSPACKANKEFFEEKIKNLNKSCKDDIQRFCNDLKPGEGKVMKCLRDNEANLSAECKSAIPSPRSLFMKP